MNEMALRVQRERPKNHKEVGSLRQGANTVCSHGGECTSYTYFPLSLLSLTPFRAAGLNRRREGGPILASGSRDSVMVEERSSSLDWTMPRGGPARCSGRRFAAGQALPGDVSDAERVKALPALRSKLPSFSFRLLGPPDLWRGPVECCEPVAESSAATLT